MYVRRTRRENKDGSVVRYVQIAHNERVNGTVRAKVLVNLGREESVDVEGLRRLVASISRFLGDDPAGGVTAEGMTAVRSRSAGTPWLLDGLWRQLGIGEAIASVLAGRKFEFDVERALFALVANRAAAPMSKLAAAEWAVNDVAIPGLDAMSDDHAYRAMDVLAEADVDGKVQEAVFFAVANLLNLEVDVVFFDTTSTYFELDGEDDEDGGLRRYGHSKDHRPDLPQVVIGLAVTKEGIPVRVWCWPGNTTDQTVIGQVRDDLRHWRLGRVITVVDRGMSSAANLAYLQRGGGHFIAGERLRGSNHADEVLARPGRYQQVRDSLRVKEVKLAATPGKRWIVCHNPDQATLDAANRQRILDGLEAELAQLARTKRTEAHTKAECALRDHPAYGRYLRQDSNGRLVVDRAKVRAEERLDGKYLLSTSDPELSAEQVAVGYKNLLEAERAFRDLKTTLELRPVYHRLEVRIRAHVLLCWLALLLVRVAEQRSRLTWPRINTELGRVHLVDLAGPAGRAVHATQPSTTATGILNACGVPPLPRVSALQPA